MKTRTRKLISAAAAAALLAVPLTAKAAEASGAAAADSQSPPTKLETEGDFAALQFGKKIFVHDKNGQLFQTNGKYHDGELLDLFVLPFGPMQVPFILVNNDNSGAYNVYSDLWPEFAKGKEQDTIEEYYSGRVFNKAKSLIFSKTKHHYAAQKGDEAIAYTANDFGDLTKGYHESIRIKGKLRGLILFDCCPYLVVEDENKQLIVYHAGMNGAEQAGTIEIKA
ncbi:MULTISPECIES: hypothetical protein [Cohnella]|uniref:hypothetical protein n=1 Tax=Cohnella TaxID=329857 RepID=UPI0009BB4D52|nr:MULTISPECIES: hypothetical protein [Cohnella]MBN2983765.1 hypothetical protein [Cohnella algarum]